ncbi:MAG: hypothetical protein WCK51_08265 [Armatimonadota bacterium]
MSKKIGLPVWEDRFVLLLVFPGLRRNNKPNKEDAKNPKKRKTKRIDRVENSLQRLAVQH